MTLAGLQYGPNGRLQGGPQDGPTGVIVPHRKKFSLNLPSACFHAQLTENGGNGLILVHVPYPVEMGQKLGLELVTVLFMEDSLVL